MNSHWQIWLVSQQQPPSVNPFFAMLWQPPLQPPIPSPGDYDGIVQQTPGSGRSVPSRYQTNHGRRLAAAPYQQPLNHESLGSIRRDHPTDTYPGMAHTSTSGSGTGRVRRRRPAIDEDEPHCWVQFGTDHAGRWSVPEESRTDSVDSLEYEVLYEDPERVVPPPPSEPAIAESTSVLTTAAPSTTSTLTPSTTSMLTPSTNPGQGQVNEEDLDTVSLGSDS